MLIRKSRSSSYFKGIRSFPFKYKENKNAWMATPAFDDDKEMNALESSPNITVALIKDILQFMKCSET